MDNTRKDIFKHIDFDAIFTEEWYQKLTMAVIYALLKIELPNKKATNDLVSYIVDYNIQKALEKYFLLNSMPVLPRTLDWKNITATDAFTELKNIIEHYIACPTKKLYKTKILINKDSNLYNILIEWCKNIIESYPEINLRLTTTRDPNALYLTLEKIRF